MTNATTVGSDPTFPPRPVPVADAASAGFWEAAQRGELVAQRCDACGNLAYPPSQVCTACFADTPQFTWAPVSGNGVLRTWTVVRDSFLPSFANLTPFAVGEVELNDQKGLYFLARLVDVDVDNLSIGLPVSVDFVDGGEGTRIPVLKLTDGAAS